ncbi:EF-hand domain-containing protein [Nonomuraea sp. NPDC050663]|uniref:EF-hand domain-containing protein n=1 Tax=Nonomuraea sp. NPDC050663 TaxID=3364370 RepID=UPI00379F16D7
MSDVQAAAKAEFERFDSDGDGRISAEEIRKVNEALGTDGLSDAEIEGAIGAADSDGDGLIGLDEFVALIGGGKHERA